jgi:hypothetical protein
MACATGAGFGHFGEGSLPLVLPQFYAGQDVILWRYCDRDQSPNRTKIL